MLVNTDLMQWICRWVCHQKDVLDNMRVIEKPEVGSYLVDGRMHSTQYDHLLLS